MCSGSPTWAARRKRTENSPQTQNRRLAQVAAQTIASSNSVARNPPWMMPSKPMCGARGEKSIDTMPVAGSTNRDIFKP